MRVIDPDTLDHVLQGVIALRHDIHRHPDLSGHEADTVQRLLNYLCPFKPDRVIENIGGCGLSVVFSGPRPGPTTVFTSELDAVPITEQRQVPYRSTTPGVGHMCGHDGHMAAVAGLGALLHGQRPKTGRVVLLFRPQEETGLGAPAVVSDHKFTDLKPDYVFGFHNMPGYPLGHVLYRSGLFAWAATDFVVELVGKSSHGGQPGAGRSPAMALSRIIAKLENLQDWSDLDPSANASQAAYAQLGESDHGTVPGIARLRATLRSLSGEALETLCRQVSLAVADIAGAYGLKCRDNSENWIPATRNDPRAVDIAAASTREAGLPFIELDQPQHWSDDFGVLTQRYSGAFFGLGSGTACGKLHGPDFDFPDAILSPALQFFWSIMLRINGG